MRSLGLYRRDTMAGDQENGSMAEGWQVVDRRMVGRWHKGGSYICTLITDGHMEQL